MSIYSFEEHTRELYDLLQDDQSKDVFWARFQFDMDPSLDKLINLFSSSVLPCSGIAINKNDLLRKMRQRDDIQLVLYGAGKVGTSYSDFLMKNQIDFLFCDKDKAGQSFCGKRVLSPVQLLDAVKKYYVIITSSLYSNEIVDNLKKQGFPEEHILYGLSVADENEVNLTHRRYFEFPELYSSGVFVDAGCFDAADSIYFSRWQANCHSGIIAFEPDPANYERCKAALESSGLDNIKLFQAGMGKENADNVAFFASSDGRSYLRDSEYQTTSILRPNEASHTAIKVVALDDIDTESVGMIKMDIEGAEYDALQGAEQTIIRDKPLIAISVYHRFGDMLAIMDYLHAIVPKYVFRLRHYGPFTFDTVLYAALAKEQLS